jgi:uncharacterized membrane protein YbhN (UPF0104 family)
MYRDRLRRWLPIVLIVGGIAMIAASWSRLAAFDWVAFRQVFANIRWGWMSLAAFLVLGTYFGRVLRWQVMIRPMAPHSSWWRIFKATAIGFTSVVVLGRPGELVRPWLIAKSEKVSFSSQMAAWFLERIFDLLAVLALLGFGLGKFNGRGATTDVAVGPATQWILNTGGGVTVFLAMICIAVLFVAGRSQEVFASRISDGLGFLPEPLRAKVDATVRSFTAGMAACSSLSDLLQLFLYTIIEWVIIVGAMVCFFKAFPPTAELTTMDCVIYLGFTAFGSIMQIPGIGGGVQIAGTVVLTELFGLSAETGSGIAIANWLVTWVSILPVGLSLAASEGLHWGSLRNISEEIDKQS